MKQGHETTNMTVFYDHLNNKANSFRLCKAALTQWLFGSFETLVSIDKLPFSITNMADDENPLDMDNRDPNELNPHLKVAFEDVLGEPANAHSIDCVWKNSYKCFNCGKNCCYKFLTTLCGIFIALYWGCEFAAIAFHHIWCFTPMLRLMSILMGCCQKFYNSIVSCCLAPLCETCGLFFSQIKVQNH
ncbi:hypothetical protein KUTeg_021348 [Tegillarca granosa]|uniref:Caveolin n=1 Tax=Tegillarca granosa TaxID=220873 RepID=A0ABQ9EAI4_TEGGR|nr:hypothetical protein KUTeg_021348 [Tegillarca granosa]